MQSAASWIKSIVSGTSIFYFMQLFTPKLQSTFMIILLKVYIEKQIFLNYDNTSPGRGNGHENVQLLECT